LQIERAKGFLNDTIKLAQSDSEKQHIGYGMAAYKHRINGCIATLDQISTSNDTFRADWLGVVSPEMKKNLAEKIDALQRLPGVVTELSRASDRRADTQEELAIEKTIEDVERSVPGAGKLIDEIRFKAGKSAAPAALVSQSPSSDATQYEQNGTLVITVLRKSPHASGYAALDPQMANIPTVSVKMIASPDSINEPDILYPARTGTTTGFNVNLRSADSVSPLPLGNYVFEYVAQSPTAVQIDPQD
jgi:hypothetical protein